MTGPDLPPRARLAAAAMQALLIANPERAPRHVAAEAVEHADALLVALGGPATESENPGDETVIMRAGQGFL